MSSTSSQPNPETNTESDSASSSGSSSSPSSSSSSTSSDSSQAPFRSIDLNSLDFKQLEAYMGLTKQYEAAKLMLGLPMPLLLQVPGKVMNSVDVNLSEVALFVLTNGKRRLLLNGGVEGDFILGTDFGQKFVDICIEYSNKMVRCSELAKTLMELVKKNPTAKFKVDDDGNIAMAKRFEDLGDDENSDDDEPAAEPATASPSLPPSDASLPVDASIGAIQRMQVM